MHQPGCGIGPQVCLRYDLRNVSPELTGGRMASLSRPGAAQPDRLMMSTPKISLLAASAFLACFPLLAGAVTLGDLRVTSAPGQPLEAVLEVNDVDITLSPLLVRVAPPASYLREGVSWPQEAQDLKMARMSDDAGKVRVRVVGKQSLAEGFPLLIEMNAGGKVTVRTYQIEPSNGAFTVTAHGELPASQPAPAKAQEPKAEPEPRPEPEAKPEGTAPQEESSAAPAPAAKETPQQGRRLVRRGSRFAPDVVREYVSLNGFNPAEVFHVQQDMTLWSIAQLYWPSYPGALLEQTAVALTNKNPDAFVNGDPSRIRAGESLAAPTSDEVFAIDPLEAFRKVHGASAEVPEPTQNLIDAQRRSREAAGETAAAQLAAKSRGASSETVAEAGRAALSSWEAEHPGAGSAAPQAAVTPAPEVKKPQVPAAEKESEPASPAAAAEPKAAENAAASEAAASEKPAAEPSAGEAKNAQQAAQEQAAAGEAKPADAYQNSQSAAAEAPSAAKGAAAQEDGKRPMVSYVLVLAGILILAVVTLINRRKKRAQEKAQKASAEGVVSFQRDVPPATDAQLKAVDATVSEAVKNGTTAGAMGAGSMAYAQAQMEADKAAEAPDAAEASEASEASGTAEAAEAAEAPKAPAEAGEPATSRPAAEDPNQPWLSAEDAELPPLSDEERESSEQMGAKGAEMLAELGRIDLSLDDAAPARKADAPAVPPYIPPLAPEPIASEDAPLPPAFAPSEPAAVPPPEPVRVPNERERARLEAIEAKLSLAKSFLSLGAKKEALELLSEARKEGTEQQRAAAQEMLDRIRADGAI